MVAMELSGSSGRSFLLLVTNLVLLILGAIMIAAGSIISSIFLLHLLTFASQLFYVTPILLITSGTLTIMVAIFGLSLFKKKTEGSNSFMAYAGVLFVAMCIAVAACVTSFVLREAIAHRFSKTNVRAELLSYSTDPIVRGRWDTLQHEYSCCGGYNPGTGYTDWEGIPIDVQPADGAAFAPLLSSEGGDDSPRQLVPTLTAVPDSCCLKMTPGCGKQAFTDEVSGGTVRESSLSEHIHVNGCMTVVWLALYKHVMPALMICALVALVVALVELLLLLSACCFADHIRRLQRGDSEKANSEKEGIIDSNEEAYSMHHEEKAHEYSLEGGRPSGSSYYDQDNEQNSDLGSWYADSSSDGAPATVGSRPAGHQLPMLEQSPSLRKNRYFFQSSDGVHENGSSQMTQIELGEDSTAAKALLAEVVADEPVVEGGDETGRRLGNGGHSAIDARSAVIARLPRLFSKFIPSSKRRQKSPAVAGDEFEMGRKEAMREDALVREKTIMDVLKSVTRSKSRENVIEDVSSKIEGDVADGGGGGEVIDPVKKLPTIGRTIDRSRKYRPMENLSETPVKRKSGLDRLKQIKNDMFGGKKEQKEEEEMQQQHTTDTKGDVEVSSIQFDLQKSEVKSTHELASADSESSSAAELGPVSTTTRDLSMGARERRDSGTREQRDSISGARERRDSESGTRERRDSGSGARERRDSGSGVRERRESGSGLRERRESGSDGRERHLSGQESSFYKPGHTRRPSDGNATGIPQLVRDSSLTSTSGQQPRSILSQKSSISDTSDRVTSPVSPPTRNASARFDLSGPEIETKRSVASSASLPVSTSPTASSTRPVRVSGFGVSENAASTSKQPTKSSIRRSTRNLSLTSNPKLNTIHEPNDSADDASSKLRSRSLAQGPDSPEVKFSNLDVQDRVPSRPSLGGPQGYFYEGGKWRSEDQNSQLIVRSDEQLNRAETSQLIRQGSIEKSRPLSASLSGDRKPSSESVTHVTRIRVEKEDELPADVKPSKKGKKEEKEKEKTSKDKEKKKEKDKKKEKEKEKKQKEKEKEKEKKKKKKKEEESSKKRRPSSSESESSESDDSDSDESENSDSNSSDSDSSDSSSNSDSSSSSIEEKSVKKSKVKHGEKKEKKLKSKDKEKEEKKKSKKTKKRSESPEKKKEKSSKKTLRKSSSEQEEKEESKKKKKHTKKSDMKEGVMATLEATTSPRGTPFPSQPLYDNVEMMRLSAMVSPTPNWAKVQLSSQPPSDFYLTATNVDEPQEVAYYTTATLPSGASLRRSGYNLSVPADAPRLVPVSDRGMSEPRILVTSGDRGATLDRYMMGRSKSQERVPVKLRRQTVHQDTMQYLKVAPPQGQGASAVAAASAGSSRARSVSEAPDGLWEYVQHQQQNPQFYRTSVEYDSMGEAYTVHQSASGRPVHSAGYKSESRKMTAPIMDPQQLQQLQQQQQQHLWSRDPQRHHHPHHHTSETKLVIHPSEELMYQQQQQRQHQPSYR